uniref:Uncharacterized protein n=1 Tax=Arundo donax TaxID=35708 RepID=A0A0A8ZIG8_ARUDO
MQRIMSAPIIFQKFSSRFQFHVCLG